jgi:fatty-acyl-CoA synthase
MKGLMMETQLLISSIAKHAEKFHGDREIVSVTADNPQHRYTVREAMMRARQLANALARLGVKQGDRVASLAWNDYRHLEVYYGVSGSGYVCHTINPRLFPEQIVYIVNHAEDRFICVDAMFVPLDPQSPGFGPGAIPAAAPALNAETRLLEGLLDNG